MASSSTSLNLAQMVDLALGTPEVGAVNFNVLHTLLHAMLAKLDISESQALINEEDKEFLSRKVRDDLESVGGRVSTADSGISRYTADNQRNLGMDQNTSVATPVQIHGESILSDSKYKNNTSRTPYHQLELKVNQLEYQFESLNSLPSTTDLYSQTCGDSERNPVTDMWQSMQMSKKVEANEEGVGKLMSLVQDLMRTVQSLKEDNEEMKVKLDQLVNDKKHDDFLEKINQLNSNMNELDQRLCLLNSENWVTWEGLENSLKGIREEFSQKETKLTTLVETPVQTSRNPTPEPKIIEEPSVAANATVTPPTSRPLSAISRPASRPVSGQSRPASRSTSAGPSLELQSLLEQLGTLSDNHILLKKKVAELEDALNGKADKSDLAAIQVPDDLVKDLKNIKNQLEMLKNNQTDADALSSRLADLHLALASLESSSARMRDEMHHVTGELGEQLCELKEAFMAAPLDQGGDSLDTKPESVSTAASAAAAQLVTAPPAPLASTASADARLQQEPAPPPGPQPSLLQETGAESDVMAVDTRRLLSIEDKLHRRASELRAVNQKMALLTHDTSRQLMQLQARFAELENELARTSERLQLALDARQQLDRDAAASASPQHPAPEQAAPADDSDSQMNNEMLKRMQKVIDELRSELSGLSQAAQQLVEENVKKQTQIDGLSSMCDKLEFRKADKEFVQMEVNVKADKHHLDGKVNKNLFDTTCDELSKMISDILLKMTGHEDEWKKLLGQLTNDIDGKLDRLEFGPIREELEKQLRGLAKKLANMDFTHMEGDDEAAGLRKQLIQRFNCISCDRPVDMTPHGPMPSIPASSGLPATRSTRPYTTFELEQIRQYAKNGNNMTNVCNFERALFQQQLAAVRHKDYKAFMVHYGKNATCFSNPTMDVVDYYATTRACGGNHTLTYPHRRITRSTHITNLFSDGEELSTSQPANSSARVESDIQGADGHIYKGRLDSNKLPQLQQAVGAPQKQAKKTPVVQPTTPKYPSRPTSSRSVRPNSALRVQNENAPDLMEVPTGEILFSMTKDSSSPPLEQTPPEQEA